MAGDRQNQKRGCFGVYCALAAMLQRVVALSACLHLLTPSIFLTCFSLIAAAVGTMSVVKTCNTQSGSEPPGTQIIDDATASGLPSGKHAPPQSDSEYSWHYVEHRERMGGMKRCWWRNVDAMANFILHWQTRFHQHGDMFVSCLLRTQVAGEAGMVTVSVLHVREAMRRLRFSHPSVALRLARRSELGLEPLAIPHTVAEHVDLQVALVYDVLESEADVQRWLDTSLVVHTEQRTSQDRDDDDLQQYEFQQHVAAATANTVPGRTRLVIHFWPADAKCAVPARILLEQCHSVSDGVGTFILFDELLRSLAGVLDDSTPRELHWGSEVSRLEPALQDAIAEVPKSWSVSTQELKAVKKVNADRMNGKASAPTFIDRIGAKLIAAALRGDEGHRSAFRRHVLNKPLVKMCRSVAEKGDMLPLGLLPHTGKPYTGPVGHTAMFVEQLTPTQTGQLLVKLNHNQTMAPFVEACMHMATTWVRKHRGLVPQFKRRWNGYDDPNRILGSFSNAVDKRTALVPQYRRYVGLCMGGFPTNIGAGSARWSTQSEPSRTGPFAGTAACDPMPVVTSHDLAKLVSISTQLAAQYRVGRSSPHWLRYQRALMFNTMQTEYLFLRDHAHYPSMPWLSSLGKLESIISSHYPLQPSRSPRVVEPLSNLPLSDLPKIESPLPEMGALDTSHAPHTLMACEFRIVGRNGTRQPILHVYTSVSRTILQLSYPDWLYPPPNSILPYWLDTVKSLLLAFIADA